MLGDRGTYARNKKLAELLPPVWKYVCCADFMKHPIYDEIEHLAGIR